MAHRGARMTYITEPLAYRRVRGSSLSADTLKMQRAVVHVLEQFERNHDLSSSARAAWQDAIARARSRAGSRRRRSACRRAAWRARPRRCGWCARTTRAGRSERPAWGSAPCRGWWA
jgi:hypothetical protein